MTDSVTDFVRKWEAVIRSDGMTDELDYNTLLNENRRLQVRVAQLEESNRVYEEDAKRDERVNNELRSQLVSAQREAAHWKDLVSSADLALNPFKQTDETSK